MSKRLINCDILRMIAFIFVISVHSLLYIGFYEQDNTGFTMFFLNIVRCIFMTCVPLFAVLSGYLMKDKELSKNYIKKLFRIIITYILCSIACIICLHFIENRDVLSLKNYIAQILSFEAAPYSGMLTCILVYI